MSYQNWNILGSTLIATALLAGCGGDSGSASPSSDTSPVAASVSHAADNLVPAPAPEGAPLERASVGLVAAVSNPEAGPSLPAPVPPAAAPAAVSAPAILIPALPAVAPVPGVPAIGLSPAPSVESLPSTRTTGGRQDGSDLDPSFADNEFSGRKMQGFTNVGATCYANAALKFLIHSIGPSKLISHLEEITQIPVTGEEMAAVFGMADMIRKAHAVHEGNKDEMIDLFDAIEATGIHGGKIIGSPSSSGHFYTSLFQIFKIERCQSAGFSLRKTIVQSSGAEETTEDLVPTLYPSRDDLDLQSLVESRPALFGYKEHVFLVSDEDSLKTVNFMISTARGAKTDQLDFDHSVHIPVLSKKTGKVYLAQLKPKAITSATSSGDEISHYIAYLKYENGWALHDDWTVSDSHPNQGKLYPELISFSVEGMEELR